jgi:hypothetical protein
MSAIMDDIPWTIQRYGKERAKDSDDKQMAVEADSRMNDRGGWERGAVVERSKRAQGGRAEWLVRVAWRGAEVAHKKGWSSEWRKRNSKMDDQRRDWMEAAWVMAEGGGGGGREDCRDSEPRGKEQLR